MLASSYYSSRTSRVCVMCMGEREADRWAYVCCSFTMYRVKRRDSREIFFFLRTSDVKIFFIRAGIIYEKLYLQRERKGQISSWNWKYNIYHWYYKLRDNNKFPSFYKILKNVRILFLFDMWL